MAEHLNIGTMIDNISDQTNNATLEKYCYVNNTANCNTYGGLYQWDEMMQYVTTEGTQGICPTGWHIPTDAEWCILENFVDATTDTSCSLTFWRGTDVGKKLKMGGTSGFEVLLAGYRKPDWQFYGIDGGTNFWSCTESSGATAWRRVLSSGNAGVYRHTNGKLYGFSVRCLKD